ncbi:MAG: hypothetical protein JXR48_03435 [Candidatus Delongbacteria bacterium]|nr:hypothetical protein [Candidatus Delongbacteria bacterium]MBN2834000.1 hypothetical protein [Candidatus Delongbacteria bacterium]
MDIIDTVKQINKLSYKNRQMDDQTKAEVFMLLDKMKEDFKRSGKTISLYSTEIGTLEFEKFDSDEVNNSDRFGYHIGIKDSSLLFEILEKHHDMIREFNFIVWQLGYYCRTKDYEESMRELVEKYQYIDFGVCGTSKHHYRDMDVFRSLKVSYVKDFLDHDKYKIDEEKFMKMILSITTDLLKDEKE